jgi:hypothetical protein
MLGSEFETYGKNLEQTLQAGIMAVHTGSGLAQLA